MGGKYHCRLLKVKGRSLTEPAPVLRRFALVALDQRSRSDVPVLPAAPCPDTRQLRRKGLALPGIPEGGPDPPGRGVDRRLTVSGAEGIGPAPELWKIPEGGDTTPLSSGSVPVLKPHPEPSQVPSQKQR